MYNKVSNHLRNDFDAISEEINPILDYVIEKGNGAVCVSRHCHTQVQNCLADPICRANFQCAGQCEEGDDECTFYCSESYQSENVNNLMNCIFIEYECLDLPDPSPINNATCRDPIDYVVPGI